MAKKKGNILTSKHLTLTPMTGDELEQMAKAVDDEKCAKLCGEMLKGCMDKPNKRLWYTMWRIVKNDSGDEVGRIAFCGEPQAHTVVLYYHMETEFRDHGYGFQAVQMLVDRAFEEDGVYFVEGDVDLERKETSRVAAALEFSRDGDSKTRCVIERPITSWLPVYICLSVGAGMCFGIAVNQIIAGIVFGTLFGILMGLNSDMTDRNMRDKLNKKRKERHL